MESTTSSDPNSAESSAQETSTVATLQSLIVAFVLAMTFRGFIAEGFVIPTGSMAPTLMGEHLLLQSGQTGFTYQVDAKGAVRAVTAVQQGTRIVGYDIESNDPMLGPKIPIVTRSRNPIKRRMGDRILVLKCLFPFAEPDRFDVVVFKNPTDPDGEAENYIKRLIGLPDEAIWLVDGDVFTAPTAQGTADAAFRIQRKPDHVQRAVWQPVYNSDYIPIDPAGLPSTYAPPWSGPLWEALEDRGFRCETSELSSFLWDGRQRQLSDWTPYNMFSMARSPRAGRDMDVSDLRIAADIVAEQDGLNLVLHLDTRGYEFEFKIADGMAVTRMRPLKSTGPWLAEQSAEVPMPQAGRVYQVEFWHVDQALSIFVNGKRVGSPHAYDWTPHERIEQAFDMTVEAWKKRSPRVQASQPQLRWTFFGSPLTLRRVRVDRDLYYRADKLTAQATKNLTPPGHEAAVQSNRPAFGTHPDNLAVLGPDQFFMLGDNSPASSDSRLWGNAHPYVVEQIDDSPFLVNRKLLLGKAWVVYFPAPYPITENGRGLIPSFGRLRFIR